jgi:membrane protein required for beta-lactamase induction
VSTVIDTWRKEGERDEARCCEAEKILAFYGVDENSRILSLSLLLVNYWCEKYLKMFFFLIKK